MSQTLPESLDADAVEALRRSSKKYAPGVEGSVLEFAFGPNRSYLATSYPHPTHEANREDTRVFVK